MLKARPAKEIVLKVANKIGVLAELTKLVADKGVNLLAAGAWVEDSSAIIRLITDDNLRSVDALRAKGYNPRETEVVLIETPHKPGMLRHVAEALARDLIDIHHLYASAAGDQDKCLIVFSSSKNDRAMVLLNG